MTDTAEITPEAEEILAIERLAGTHDGALIRRYFRRVLESCRVTELDGALQRQEGGRILARDFMVHMDRGAPVDRTVDPILTRSTGPAGASRPRGIARRVPASNPYDTDADAS